MSMKEDVRQQIARLGGIQVEPARTASEAMAAWPHAAIAWPHAAIAYPHGAVAWPYGAIAKPSL